MNIKDVAEKAGVSITTVSRVMNTPEKVNKNTLEKVLATMEELNYTPNWFARNLQTSKTGFIGVLVQDNMQQSDMNIVKGIEEIALKKGSNVIQCNTGFSKETEMYYIKHLIERKVDGLVLISSVSDEDAFRYIREKNVPFVLVDNNYAAVDANMVYTNYASASKEVIKYMAEMGRKRIALILPKGPVAINDLKRDGYMNGLHECGLEVDDELVIVVDNTIEGGFRAASKLINSDKNVDGIYVATDKMAFGVIEAMNQNDLTPEQLGVIGFNGNDEGAVVEPKLTTVSKPSHRMGLTAGRLLYDLIESEEVEEPQQVMIQSKLKIRKSCGNKERVLEIW